MSKTFKLSLVFVAVLAVVLFAQSGAWAGKLQGSEQAPSVAVNETDARCAGTTSPKAKSVWEIGHSGTLHGILHIHMVKDANVGRPDGTYYSVGTDKAVTVKIEVGPNWSGSLYYYLGDSWNNIGYTRDGNTLTATFPAGTMYFAVGAMD